MLFFSLSVVKNDSIFLIVYNPAVLTWRFGVKLTAYFLFFKYMLSFFLPVDRNNSIFFCFLFFCCFRFPVRHEVDSISFIFHYSAVYIIQEKSRTASSWENRSAGDMRGGYYYTLIPQPYISSSVRTNIR